MSQELKVNLGNVMNGSLSWDAGGGEERGKTKEKNKSCLKKINKASQVWWLSLVAAALAWWKQQNQEYNKVIFGYSESLRTAQIV